MGEGIDQLQTIETGGFLQTRAHLTEILAQNPYSYELYYERARVYHALQYPDLAAMDAYKALLLLDEVFDETGEYHKEAKAASLRNFKDISQIRSHQWTYAEEMATVRRVDATLLVSLCLADCGCLRTAYDYARRAIDEVQTSGHAAADIRDMILRKAQVYFESKEMPWDEENINLERFPDEGFVRREIYPWNSHEADRYSDSALQVLNAHLKCVAPKLEVKLARVPVLSNNCNVDINEDPLVTFQLGVFAKEDLSHGEEVLREHSLLSASSRLYDPLCDACSAALPSLGLTPHNSGPSLKTTPVSQMSSPVSCPSCDDTAFCSTKCLDLAQKSYHPAVCGTDAVSVLTEATPSTAAESLYTLLLLRTLAMAQTQNMHPLELTELKYIWGDYTTVRPKSHHNQPEHPKTLPFSFQHNLHWPLHFLIQTNTNIFTARHEIAETWVHNTVIAKTRATASARLNVKGQTLVEKGAPIAAAVHPLWCLTNHSCAPNVRWGWGEGESEIGEGKGDMKFWVRGIEERPKWREHGDADLDEKFGIKRGEEVLSHYVDIELSYQQRREWGIGVLGGLCMCERCIWEDKIESGTEQRQVQSSRVGEESDIGRIPIAKLP